MLPTLKFFLLKHGVLLFLLFFASLQFFLLTRHKSPYLSDSYFYQHMYYQFQGLSFEESRAKILANLDLTKVDAITQNFFAKTSAYKNSLRFFTKRPLYPFTAFLLSLFIKNTYWDFLIPVFLGYLGTIFIAYYLFKLRLNYLFSTFATALLISFYPFLDWSTYFLTDTIGAFFWLLQLLPAYYYVNGSKNKKLLFLYSLTLIISLFNREQSLLMLLVFFILLVFAFIFRYPVRVRRRIINLVLVSLLITIIYLVINRTLNMPSLYDTILYTQNSYGLHSKTYTLIETLGFIGNSVLVAHLAFIKDLSQHHWWSVFVALGIIGMIQTILKVKRPTVADTLFLCSGLVSYSAIFFYPVLSYRFFFPAVVSIIFFAVHLISSLFQIIDT